MDFIKKNRKNACHFKNNAYLCNAFSDEPIIGRLAQLVQSICLTSRGSGVRIPQRPPKFLFREKHSEIGIDESY